MTVLFLDVNINYLCTCKLLVKYYSSSVQLQMVIHTVQRLGIQCSFYMGFQLRLAKRRHDLWHTLIGRYLYVARISSPLYGSFSHLGCDLISIFMSDVLVGRRGTLT